jgi:hypothetical protein
MQYGFAFLLTRLGNFRASCKLNYVAAWPSVVRNGFAFLLKRALQLGLRPSTCVLFFHPLFVNDAPKEGTAQNPKATQTERQSHSSQQTAKPQRS